MLLTYNPSWITIAFTSDDWDAGRATKLMDVLKQLPTIQRRYNPSSKSWIVHNSVANRTIVDTYKDKVFVENTFTEQEQEKGKQELETFMLQFED